MISPRRIESIGITSNTLINASAIKLAALNEIPIYYYNYTGELIAQLIAPSFLKQSTLRLCQLVFMNGEKGTLWIVEQLKSKTNLQIQTLTRVEKINRSVKKSLQIIKDEMNLSKNKLLEVNCSDQKVNNTLMGLEGNIARNYFIRIKSNSS